MNYTKISTIQKFPTIRYVVRENQHPDDCLLVGIVTKTCVRKLLEEGDIGQAQVTKFYDGAPAFYVPAMEYALENLPMNDEMLRNAAFVSFRSKESANFSQVEYFVQRFNTLLPYGSPQDLDHLMENLHSTSYWKTVKSSGCVGKGHCCRKRRPHILPNGYSIIKWRQLAKSASVFWRATKLCWRTPVGVFEVAAT